MTLRFVNLGVEPHFLLLWRLPAGSESYFKVTLEPGRYSWVQETWGVQGMVQELRVE